MNYEKRYDLGIPGVGGVTPLFVYEQQLKY
jgi:hypothetical protein